MFLKIKLKKIKQRKLPRDTKQKCQEKEAISEKIKEKHGRKMQEHQCEVGVPEGTDGGKAKIK